MNLTLKIIAALAVVGAIVETFVPGLITEKLQGDFTAITICLIGIVCSYFFLIILLKVRIREGFEDASLLNRWTTLGTSFKIKDVCTLYTEIYEKMFLVEKGAAPAEVKTEVQAREAVDKQFSDVMTAPPLSCSLVEEVDSNALKLDTLYLAIQKVPDSLLVQVYETAIACRTLLIRQYLKVTEAENKKADGFEDLRVCSEGAEKERKLFKERKPLSAEAQTCLLVEEVPADKKQKVVENKLASLERTVVAYRKVSPVKDSLEKILQDCAYYKGELDKKKKEAEDRSNQYSW